MGGRRPDVASSRKSALAVSGAARTLAARPVPQIQASPDRNALLHSRTTGAFALLAGLTMAACAARTPATPVSGRVDTFRIAMPQLGGRERTVRVYLPPGHDGRDRRLPVLYMQDGQQLFTAGPYGDWLVDETLDRLAAGGAFDGVIVVGVDNGPRRWDEYGPWRNSRMHDWIDASWAQQEEGGEGDAYVDFLVRTLKPEVDRRYRTLPDREHTAIGGSSMGGLIAIHAALVHPEVFSKVMAMSTAVWFAEGGGPWLSDNRLVRAIEEGAPPLNVRFWLGVGTAERSRESEPGVRDADGAPVTYPRAYLEGSRAVARALAARGVPPSQLRHVEEEGAPHHESAWARWFPEAVQWLFDGRS